jgi:Outer membrane protein beta-barrel domain
MSAIRAVVRATTLILCLLWFGVAEARGDGWISPFVGVNFGGSAGGTFSQVAEDRQHLTYGFDAGGMFGGVFGLEFDFAYTSQFFGSGSQVVDNSLMTVMPAFIVGIPVGGQKGLGFRPYATAGAGLIRRSIGGGPLAILTGSDFGYSVGGGAMLFLGTPFGIRGDYRYFRNFEVDNLLALGFQRGTFNFSRATIAAVFRF